MPVEQAVTRSASRIRTFFAREGARSIRASLVLLVTVCVLPGSLMSAFLIYDGYKGHREQLIAGTIANTRAMAALLDRDLASVEAGMHILAASPLLRVDNLEGFYHFAKEVIPPQSVNTYVLVDMDGRQRLNTSLPWGAPLPTQGHPQLRGIFESGTVAVTDVFIGPLTGKPLIAIGAPVFREGKVVYVLIAGIFPDRVAALMQRQRLAPGWIGEVFDRTGTLIARTHELERFAGRKAVPDLVRAAAAAAEGTIETVTLESIPVVTAFSRSEVSNWTVAVGIPKSTLIVELRKSLWFLIAATTALLAGGLWLAWTLGDRIARAMHGLIGPALELGSGNAVAVPPLHLKEADEVGQALIVASALLSKVQQGAHYDGLTGLANRALFHDMLKQQLALCARTHAELSVLYIDLDGFKAINDAHGHATGDDLLRTAAIRLAEAIRDSDVAARFGGDEFVVLLAQSGGESARIVAEKLVGTLSAPYQLTRVEVRISASIGVATFPGSAGSAASLLERADAAMYEAKKSGKNSYAMAGQVAHTSGRTYSDCG